MSDNLIFNRWTHELIASVSYQEGADFQENVSEIVVFKTPDGSFAYAQTGHCSCCGSNYQGLSLTAMELGTFILTARKWSREVPAKNDLERVAERVKRLIDVVIDYVDGDREKKIEEARAKINFERDKLRKLSDKRTLVIAEMDKMISSVTNDLATAQETFNKLTN